MDQKPSQYTEQLHAQARDIARRIVAAADALPAGKPRLDAAHQLAIGPIATEITMGADCCLHDQFGLAVMVAAELALHCRPEQPRAATPNPR
ncbi:hypothetical protein Ait01nite_030380 [Actinoplanes italicus]|uniref:Uncharacterized protein n=1 Tax=Actinoplanes italicus TaxID=113567 RepID=A0A2T0KIZ8_9ACTN|nr:hypothetical protein [Actinoplanes italicus]PRX23497.1 hypothetical protein CLV67_103245 [Actinoplanes italicus]GIE29993.1 hypothetical protein Ait01nite_030380 [Actinoplanes italicus]